MLNALTMMAARDRGGTFGIGVDGDDFILESCVLNVVVRGVASSSKDACAMDARLSYASR